MHRYKARIELIVIDCLVCLGKGNKLPQIARDRAELTDGSGRIGRQYTAHRPGSTTAASEDCFSNVVRNAQPARISNASDIFGFINRKSDVEPFAALCCETGAFIGRSSCRVGLSEATPTPTVRMRAERRRRRRDLALSGCADDAAGVVRTATGLRREKQLSLDTCLLRCVRTHASIITSSILKSIRKYIRKAEPNRRFTYAVR